MYLRDEYTLGSEKIIFSGNSFFFYYFSSSGLGKTLISDVISAEYSKFYKRDGFIREK